jgi:SAM-dependent methyltransferase
VRRASAGLILRDLSSAHPTGDRVAAPPDAFGFGRNWRQYITEHLTPERERAAAESLRSWVPVDLSERTFLDVGAGSGLFSLSAHRAGAARVVSLDVDPDSVACCRALRESAGAPEGWEVREGSILDDRVVAALAPADVVYSWGVLHHTGDMHTAIRNAASLVKPGGLFVIAIYNRATGRFDDSERWLRIKRFYNHSSRPVQLALERAYEAYVRLNRARRRVLRGRAPGDRQSERGMVLRTDVIDWIGGYPYEFATADEIVGFCEAECGMHAVRVESVPARSHGNNRFVFERAAR